MSEKINETYEIEKSEEIFDESTQNNKSSYKENEIMPLIPLRGLVVFPNTTVHFDVGRKKSIDALNKAVEEDKYLFLCPQRNPETEEPSVEDLYSVGTVVKVKQILKLQNGIVRALVEGIYKGNLIECFSSEPYYEVVVKESFDRVDDIDYTKAAARHMRTLFNKYAKIVNVSTSDIGIRFTTFEDIQKYTYIVASRIIVGSYLHEIVIDEDSLYRRIEKVTSILEEEIKLIRLEQKIAKKTKDKMDKHQKEYFLKQQIKSIQEELGDKEDIYTEIEKYRTKMREAKLPKYAIEKIENEIKRLEKSESFSAENSNIRAYIDLVLSIPWKKASKDNNDIQKIKEILEEGHYGLEEVKERILEFIAVRKLSKGLNSPIICLVGPPGVGKTSVAKSIADSMGRKFIRMSLGGVKDESEIRGHRRTYIGSMPGRIISGMKDAKVVNPVFLLDEIDKMGSDYKGDPASAMLEVLDPEQNKTFKDHYLEIEYDLSKVLFITTANSLDTIPRPLLDRMEIIQLSGYTDVEKKKIATDYLIPKQLEKHGIKQETINITNEALEKTIADYTREAGVRNLQRQIAKICRKSAIKIIENDKVEINVNEENLKDYLGPAKYKYSDISKKDSIGVVNGLAWTQYGGDTLPIEVAIMKGNGKLELTGKLGDVMKESAKIGYSYIRANAKKYGIDEDFYKNFDIHIHAPEGAVPKDGPSAGVTMITAMISALSKKPVRGDVAMTGEVTLTGDVLAIGGVKEKSLSAYRAGIRTIILPEENRKDIVKVPDNIREDINFVFAEKVDTVINTAIRGEINDN